MRVFMRKRGSGALPRAGVHRCTLCMRRLVVGEDVALFESLGIARGCDSDERVQVSARNVDGCASSVVSTEDVEIMLVACRTCVVNDLNFGKQITLSAGKVGA